MKSYSHLTVVLLASFVLAAHGSTSQAAAVAGDDFDGGANNGGLTPTSLVLFEGDPNSGSTAVEGVHYDVHPNTANGLFDGGSGASRFDRWGTVDPLVKDSGGVELEMAADYLDQTTPGVADPNRTFLPYDPDDRLGIQPLESSDRAFAVADTCNGGNITGDCAPSALVPPGQIAGSVSAYWTFDISSGSSPMQISIDIAANGEFDNANPDSDPAINETADFLTFTYSIDGGPFLPAFDIRPQADPNGNDTEEFYTITMDSDPNGNAPGPTYDRYPSPFFVESTWQQLHDNGEGFGITCHPLDTNCDSYVDLEGALGNDPNSRAYSQGGFDNTEFEVFKNPLYVNGTTQVGGDLQTVTVPIVGSGSVLTLKLLGVGDGSLEFTLFDNILIEEVAAANADFDGNGIVDGLDFLRWQRGDTPEGGSQAELALWEAQYGGPPPVSALSTVPEPASALLLVVGLGLTPFALRRRNAMR